MDNRQSTTNDQQRQLRKVPSTYYQLPSARNAFTLVESLVAISIFLIVTSVAVGTFIQALKSQRMLTTMMSVTNNTTTALEQVAREIRTGYNFCPDRSDPLDPCNKSGDSVSFTNYEGIPTTIAWDRVSGAIVRSSTRSYPITAPNVEIDAAQFMVSQDYPTLSPCAPWRVTLAIVAKSRDPNIAERSFAAQITTSVRTLPLESPSSTPEILQHCDRIL